MVIGESFEEEPMTTAPHRTESELIDHLLGRDDLTVDDIADLPEDLRYELIDGRLVLSPLAIPVHQLLSRWTANAIDENCPDEYILNVEQAILINGRNELRPDVVVVHERAAFVSPVLPADVPLLVEVVSRSSKKFDRTGKLEKYAAVGIPTYWILDPLADRVTLARYSLGLDGANRMAQRTAEQVTVDDPWKITLDLPAWTRKRDQLSRVSRGL